MEELIPIQRDITTIVEAQEQNNTVADKEGGDESDTIILNKS